MLSIDHLTLAIIGAGSGNRTRTLSLEGSYDTISPYPQFTRYVIRAKISVKHITTVKSFFTDQTLLLEQQSILSH